MIQDPLNAIQDKQEKKPIDKYIILIAGVLAGIFIYFYVKDRTIGFILFAIIMGILIFFGSRQETNIALTLNEATSLLRSELMRLINDRITNRFDIILPQDITISNIKFGNFDRLRDSLTFEILEWHIGFSIKKDGLTHYFVGKIDYWVIYNRVMGNGVVGMNFLGNNMDNEFKKVTPIEVKTVPIEHFPKWKEAMSTIKP